jgi:hypothetical protein
MHVRVASKNEAYLLSALRLFLTRGSRFMLGRCRLIVSGWLIRFQQRRRRLRPAGLVLLKREFA